MSIAHVQIPPGQMGLVNACIAENPKLKGKTIEVRETLRALISIGGPRVLRITGQARTHRGKSPEQMAELEAKKKAQAAANRAAGAEAGTQAPPKPEPTKEALSAPQKAKVKKKTSKAKATKKKVAKKAPRRRD